MLVAFHQVIRGSPSQRRGWRSQELMHVTAWALCMRFIGHTIGNILTSERYWGLVLKQTAGGTDEPAARWPL
jgi:hypothetical protein